MSLQKFIDLLQAVLKDHADGKTTLEEMNYQAKELMKKYIEFT